MSSTLDDTLVQYVVVRRDLLEQWPTGSVIAQGVHASVSAVWTFREDDVTKEYCRQDVHQPVSAASQMHTVVLEAKNEDAVLKLAEKLEQNGIQHVVWKEQPENFVTALAAKPYPRSVVKPYFNKFRLFK